MINEKEFAEKLSVLVKEYNLKNCVFCANDEDRMLGYFAVEKLEQGASFEDVVKCCILAARTYQSAREKIFTIMDKVSGI